MAKNVLKEARRRAAAQQFDAAQRRASAGSTTGVRVFRCEACDVSFTTAWSEDEARAEAEQLFGDATAAPQAVVCDPCFERMKRAGVFPS